MDRRNNGAVVWGIILVALGLLFLAQNLGIMGVISAFVWIVLFGMGGAAFLYVFLSEPDGRWWAIIPALTMLGLSALLMLEALPGRIGDILGAPTFLLALSLSFWVIFFTRRTFWWAIIPGGVLASVSMGVLLDELHLGIDTGGIILLGMGATFLLVSFLDSGRGHMRWALIPAGVLSLIGLAILLESISVLGYAWPVFLIGAGAYFIVRSRASQE